MREMVVFEERIDVRGQQLMKTREIRGREKNKKELKEKVYLLLYLCLNILSIRQLVLKAINKHLKLHFLPSSG